MSDVPAMIRQQEHSQSLAQWLLGAVRAEPGWDSITLELKPVDAAMLIRIHEARGGAVSTNAGQFDQGTQPYQDARALRDACAGADGSRWLSAKITVGATGWPDPRYSLDAHYNYDQAPEDFGLGEPTTAAPVTEAPGQPDPAPAGSRPAEPTPAEPARADPAPAQSDGGPGEWIPGASAPSSETLTVRVDRDSVPSEGGARPNRRQFELDRNSSFADVLAHVGLPLTFTDGQGVWLVRRSPTPGEGPILAVVGQGPEAQEQRPQPVIKLAMSESPLDRLNPDGAFYLYYQSVTRDADDIVTALMSNEDPLRSKDPSKLVDNATVRAAVAEFAQSPSQAGMLHVLRQSFQGQLLLDATGSEGESSKITTVPGPDGGEALLTFTRQEELGRFRQSQGKSGEVKSFVQSAHGVLDFFRSNTNMSWLYIDPAGPTCALARREVEYALQSRGSIALKEVLSGTATQQAIFNALTAPEATLFVGELGNDGKRRPLVLQSNERTSLLAVFTSIAEVAAFDSSLKFSGFTPSFVLNFVFTNRIGGMVINPGGPSAEVSGYQIWHILGNPRLDPK